MLLSRIYSDLGRGADSGSVFPSSLVFFVSLSLVPLSQLLLRLNKQAGVNRFVCK